MAYEFSNLMVDKENEAAFSLADGRIVAFLMGEDELPVYVRISTDGTDTQMLTDLTYLDEDARDSIGTLLNAMSFDVMGFI